MALSPELKLICLLSFRLGLFKVLLTFRFQLCELLGGKDPSGLLEEFVSTVFSAAGFQALSLPSLDFSRLIGCEIKRG